MPRQARIDAPGALHHIIIRGIERKKIFTNDDDRKDYLERLGGLLVETETACYAWALMTNHIHLLLRTGGAPIATVMRRLLTGYAISYNLRHKRHGHLFQNRYKSILCEEDSYLKQLVAYIHLNPYRVGLVGELKDLKNYPYTGHGALLNQKKIPWQDTAYVLSVFGQVEKNARRNYINYVLKVAGEGRNPELVGGGLIRSAGGWGAVKEAYRSGIRLSSDERILGGSDFVEKVLSQSGEEYERQMRLKACGLGLSDLVSTVCCEMKVELDQLSGVFRSPDLIRSRALISYLGVKEFGITGQAIGSHIGVNRSTVSRLATMVSKDAEMTELSKRILARLTSKTGQDNPEVKERKKQRPL